MGDRAIGRPLVNNKIKSEIHRMRIKRFEGVLRLESLMKSRIRNPLDDIVEKKVGNKRMTWRKM